MRRNHQHRSRVALLPLATAFAMLSACSAAESRATTIPSQSPQTASRAVEQQPEGGYTTSGEKPAVYKPAAPEYTVRTPAGHLVNDCVPKRLWKSVTTLTTKDQKHLSTLILGKGPNAIYFGHQYGGQICNLLDLAEGFVKRGYRVIMPEFRGHVASEESETSSPLDAKAAFDKLKKLGTKRVFLTGASCGGTTAATEGVKSGIPLVGLTLLSSPARCDGDAVAAVKKIKQPSLFMVAHDDMQGLHERDIREMFEASAARDKRLIAIDGEAHGTLMLYGSKEADKLRAKVIDFIADTYAASLDR
ncbi:S9 family peptidase [Streptomyces sp. NBC_00878]|uniref:alpha/beta hydrolase family protein n=1 Tax=Streptomyces sp. NBC_00878 TaxID=2975854 RepID=UPI002254D0B8|nr:alpha/beta hydrolase [Streptomyces sp. NBC_00878]MCX4911189.1 alpha/beta hydrolase [Streptomyces sp. NBC_00878]